MSDPFIDLYLPDDVQGIPCNSTPRFSTRITLAKSGDEARNQNWRHPLRKFSLPEAICNWCAFEQVQTFWLIMGGPLSTWPFTDPFDFGSVAVASPGELPDISGSDQALGAGDGSTTDFQLVKTRTQGAYSYARPIYLPQVDTVAVLMQPPGGVAVAPNHPSLDAHGGPYTFAVSRPGGVVTFDPAPADALVLTCGFLFDTEVRWEADDSFDGVVHSMETSGASPLTFVEVRPS